MPAEAIGPVPAIAALDEILLNYLQAVWPWPGGDGLTRQDVLACYPRAVRLGRVPTCEQLCCLHPSRIGELRAIFDSGW